jgi:hypothetical protein
VTKASMRPLGVAISANRSFMANPPNGVLLRAGEF